MQLITILSILSHLLTGILPQCGRANTGDFYSFSKFVELAKKHAWSGVQNASNVKRLSTAFLMSNSLNIFQMLEITFLAKEAPS